MNWLKTELACRPSFPSQILPEAQELAPLLAKVKSERGSTVPPSQNSALGGNQGVMEKRLKQLHRPHPTVQMCTRSIFNPRHSIKTARGR